MAIRQSLSFLTTGIALAHTVTKTNGTDFTSAKISIPDGVDKGLLGLTWTRASGSTSLTVDFYFQASNDNGTTWWDYAMISDATGVAAVTGTTVQIARQVSLAGMTHIQLSSMTNNDTSNDLTAVNVGIAIS